MGGLRPSVFPRVVDSRNNHRKSKRIHNNLTNIAYSPLWGVKTALEFAYWRGCMKFNIEEPMLRRRSVEQMTGLSKSTLYRLIKQGNFPPPLRLTTKAVRWRREEVNEWLSLRPRGGGRSAS